VKDLSEIPTAFTSVIATREFNLTRNGVCKKLVVEIGKPINDVETICGFDWRCPLRLCFESTVINENACGADSFQALSLCLSQLVQLEVERFSKSINSTIELFGEGYNFENY
tara:strand:+ start:280 stop:615 length:336 start_codon:yes stop_codon:yes gene_type:complete